MPPGDASSAASPALKFPPRDPRGWDNNFNFLRLLLASLVILSHSPELLDGNQRREILNRVFHTISFGEVAVDGFFLLSGFLILQSWQREPRLPGYVKKRVLRIVPAFVVAFLVSVLIVGPLAAPAAAYFAGINPRNLLVSLLGLKEPALPAVFEGLPYPFVNGSLWTISHEFRCYLLVPVLAWLGCVRNRVGWLIVSTAVLLLWVFGPAFPPDFMSGKAWTLLLADDPDATFRLLASFCAGGCFYLFRSEVRYRAKWAAVAAAILIPCLFEARLAQLALPTAGAYLLFWFAFARLPTLDFFKTHSDVSYGVYLYGWPTQSLLIWYVPGIPPWTVCAATLGICLGLGLVSWRVVELPFLRLKSRHDPRDVLPQAVHG